MINAERLQTVLTHIRDNPELHRQDLWTCGTSACFAGWTTRLFGVEDGWTNIGFSTDVDGICGAEVWERDGTHYSSTRMLAITLLGLTNDQAFKLFNGGNTIGMIELMVKDLVNGHPMQTLDDYYFEVGSQQ